MGAASMAAVVGMAIGTAAASGRLAIGAGIAGAGYYGAYGYRYPYYGDPYYYGAGYDDGGYGAQCYLVRQRVITQWGWRVRRAQVCE